MNAADWLIIGIIAVLFILAVIYIRRNGTCTENCETCHGVCHKKGGPDGSVPSFVEAYRKDHPKQDK